MGGDRQGDIKGIHALFRVVPLRARCRLLIHCTIACFCVLRTSHEDRDYRRSRKGPTALSRFSRCSSARCRCDPDGGHRLGREVSLGSVVLHIREGDGYRRRRQDVGKEKRSRLAESVV